MAYDYTDNVYRAHRYEGDSSCIGYEYTTTGQLKRVAHYDYNAEGEGSWELDTSEHVITYQFDAAGRRVAKLVDGEIEERYLWAGHNTTLLAVYGPTGTTPIARFEYGVGRMPVRMTQNSATYYFAYDQVGSLRAVFDSSGNVVHKITYDSYGNIQPGETNSGLNVPFGFAGGLHDRDTGMVLFGFRDYDPETGTWLTPDPIGFAGGDTYLYGYCGGDPVNWADPDGLSFLPSDMYSAYIRDAAYDIVDTVVGAPGRFVSKLKVINAVRNRYIAPVSSVDAIKKISGIVKRSLFTSVFHRGGPGNFYNRVWEAPDGSEWVEHPECGIITTGGNKGTYNYYNSKTDPLNHAFWDLGLDIAFGNGPDDDRTFMQRALPWLYLENPDAVLDTYYGFEY